MELINVKIYNTRKAREKSRLFYKLIVDTTVIASLDNHYERMKLVKKILTEENISMPNKKLHIRFSNENDSRESIKYLVKFNSKCGIESLEVNSDAVRYVDVTESIRNRRSKK